MNIGYIVLIILAGLLLTLGAIRLYDYYSDKHHTKYLNSFQPKNPKKYDPNMVGHLPQAVQRFFNYVITPGTPLYTVATIDMGGEFSLGTLEKPNYQTMQAHQVLAGLHGFIWKLTLPATISVTGSDTNDWTRFRIAGLVPVVRAGGTRDHARSAFGRYISEAMFWSPAVYLLHEHITWQELNAHHIRATLQHNDNTLSVDMTIDDQGQPQEVYFMRHSNANPQKVYRQQPFGGTLKDFRLVQGFRLPFEVSAGNMYGTKEYFAFFKAKVNTITFVH